MNIAVGKYVFRSDFCSGNLASVSVTDENCFSIEVQPDPPAVDASVAENAVYKAWFCFAVENGDAGDSILIQISGLNKHSKLFKAGFRPVYRSLPSCAVWKRVVSSVEWHEEKTLELKFQHTFESSNERVYFAYSYPFSVEDMERMISRINLFSQLNVFSESIYFHDEPVVYTLEGRVMHLLTITSRLGQLSERDACLDGLFPQQDKIPRPHCFRKKRVIFITARVHPGETQASHVFNGFLEFILSSDARASHLRDRFVFQLVPCVNPDGVSRGFYRGDSRGANLNRCYARPLLRHQPTVWAIMQIVKQHHAARRLAVFIDIHAHVNKRGYFVYGNALRGAARVEALLFARLLALNSAHADFAGCEFTAANMSATDRRGESRDGSARVAVHAATGLPHCYTLECNYHASASVHELPPLRSLPPLLQEEATSVSVSAASARAVPVWPRPPSSTSCSPPFSSEASCSVSSSLSALVSTHESATACHVTESPRHARFPVCSFAEPALSLLSSAGERYGLVDVAPSECAPSLADVLFTDCPYFDRDCASEVQPLEYDVPKLLEMGQSLGATLSDLFGFSSVSRLPHSEFCSLDGIRRWAQHHVQSLEPSFRVSSSSSSSFLLSSESESKLKGCELVRSASLRTAPTLHQSKPRQTNSMPSQPKSIIHQSFTKPRKTSSSHRLFAVEDETPESKAVPASAFLHVSHIPRVSYVDLSLFRSPCTPKK